MQLRLLLLCGNCDVVRLEVGYSYVGGTYSAEEKK
jgi:hypothetical protein